MSRSASTRSWYFASGRGRSFPRSRRRQFASWNRFEFEGTTGAFHGGGRACGRLIAPPQFGHFGRSDQGATHRPGLLRSTPGWVLERDALETSSGSIQESRARREGQGDRGRLWLGNLRWLRRRGGLRWCRCWWEQRKIFDLCEGPPLNPNPSPKERIVSILRIALSPPWPIPTRATSSLFLNWSAEIFREIQSFLKRRQGPPERTGLRPRTNRDPSRVNRMWGLSRTQLKILLRCAPVFTSPKATPTLNYDWGGSHETRAGSSQAGRVLEFHEFAGQLAVLRTRGGWNRGKMREGFAASNLRTRLNRLDGEEEIGGLPLT